jgi:hypothetical protein
LIDQAGVHGSVELGDATEAAAEELVASSAEERLHLGMAGGSRLFDRRR